MKRFMMSGYIFIAALLFISAEKCNGSVLKNLNENYKRAGESKKPDIFGGKVRSQYSPLFLFVFFLLFIYPIQL